MGLFNRKRNEKEAEEEAKKKLAESKAKAEAARDKLKLEAAQKEAEKAKKEAEEAKKEVDKAKAEAFMAKRQAELSKAADAEKERKEKWEEERLAQVEATKKAAVIKHVWTNEDTYGSLAMKHYGSQKSPIWRLIFEHNRHIIGDNPNSIKTGTEIEIPPLPDELKDQL